MKKRIISVVLVVFVLLGICTVQITHSGEHSEIVDYISYLLKDGWVEVKRSEEELGLIFVFKKDNNFIQIGYVGVLEEVWISAF